MAWSVILPEIGINKVYNPNANIAGYLTAIGTGAVSRITTYSFLGSGCHRIVTNTDNTGGYFTLEVLANAAHFVTLYINTASDIDPMFDCSLDNTNWRKLGLLGMDGDWWIYGASFPASEANGSTALRIQQDGAGNNNIAIGLVQVEQNTYPTTPITGDIKGFTPGGYYWNGAPSASSSTRTAQERSGGKVVDLNTTYNFMVRFGQGRGMPPIQHHTQDMALLPGALYQGEKVMPRVLDLVSTTVASTVASIATARRDFINAIKSDRVSPKQPVVFRFSGVNESKPVDFHCYYDSGMEFGQPADEPVARFICYDPFAYEDHTQSATLTTSSSVANADYIVRKISGTWYDVSTDFNLDVFALIQGMDGCIYIGGAFNAGVAANRIVKWNPYTSTLSQLTGGSGSGANNEVHSLAIAPNGNIYLGGTFTLAGAIANTVKIAKWNGTEFVALSTGLTGDCETMTFGNDGILYIGGNFLNQFDGNGDYITKWDGTAFSSMGLGMNGIVYALATAPNGDIYAAGAFTLAGGVANTIGVARWGTNDAVPAWHSLGTGLSGGTASGHALVFDRAGNLYVGGGFTAADGVACANIAKWNGKTFEPLGSGLSAGCVTLAFDSNGMLYAGGVFLQAGGISLADRMAIWNGTTWVHIDANLPSSPIVHVILIANSITGTRGVGLSSTGWGLNSPNLYIGYDTSGTATASYLNTVTNNGSATAYPIIKIKRAEDGTSATLEWIKNETTGATLWCNYALLKGEILTIDLTPGDRSIYSNYFGDVWRAVLRGSDWSSFCLLPGENKISVFVNPVGAPTITAWMEWPLTHWSSDNTAT